MSAVATEYHLLSARQDQPVPAVLVRLVARDFRNLASAAGGTSHRL